MKWLISAPLYGQVYEKEPSSPMKQVKEEEGERSREPAHKRMKVEDTKTMKEVPEAVEVELECSIQVHRCMCL